VSMDLIPNSQLVDVGIFWIMGGDTSSTASLRKYAPARLTLSPDEAYENGSKHTIGQVPVQRRGLNTREAEQRSEILDVHHRHRQIGSQGGGMEFKCIYIDN
jgi:hypothetical protein